GLNPIQQSMVACHGAQCGFCTPGIVVSLYDLMQAGRPVDAAGVTRGLVGNLCRCTGYESIVRAALATDRSTLKPIDALYPPGLVAAALSAAAADEVRIETAAKKFYKPTTADAACAFRAANPGCSVVAGGTDLGVVHNKRVRPIEVALSLGGVAEFRGACTSPDALHVGATEPLTTLEHLANEHLPELGRYLAWFGSPLIKNAGTIGGNLVTGSPIGDTPPPLMALDAKVHVVGPAGRKRAVPINAFYTGYRQTVLAADELVAGVEIPLPKPGEVFKLFKVSRRKDLDISTFSAAIWLRLSGGTIAEARLAFGGVGPVVLRMARTEAALVGKPPTLATFEAAGDVAYGEVTPISDVRGSADYRRAVSRNILSRFWHEAFGGAQRSGGDGGGGPNGNGRHGDPPAAAGGQAFLFVTRDPLRASGEKAPGANAPAANVPA
ncbi:MAG TPA: FAD binding domain-containing protein, partial [Humisphaera sp.]